MHYARFDPVELADAAGDGPNWLLVFAVPPDVPDGMAAYQLPPLDWTFRGGGLWVGYGLAPAGEAPDMVYAGHETFARVAVADVTERPAFYDDDGRLLDDDAIRLHRWVPVHDAPPDYDRERQRLALVPRTHWSFDGLAVHAGYATAPIPLLTLKAKIKAVVDARLSEVIQRGAPLPNGLHVGLDDASRADLGALATTALAAKAGASPWPASYEQGWITLENIRVPLPTADAGLQLAASVGNFYALTRQRGRDLKDVILAAETPEALDAIPLDVGWPESV